MKDEITLQTILDLDPSFLSVEKEIYRIDSGSYSYFLEVYINSDYGCEYSLYDEDCNIVEGGVIDDFDGESEEDCAQMILNLIEELDVYGDSIDKLNEDELENFEEKAAASWRKKVKAAKDEAKRK